MDGVTETWTEKENEPKGEIQRRIQWGEGLRDLALSVLESSTGLIVRSSILFIFGTKVNII